MIIECDDPKKAKKILSSSVNEKDIIIKSNRLEILSNVEDAVKFNKELVKKDISVSALYPNYDSLEEYFMKRIGD